MASEQDKIINRVRKMLALAGNAAASEGERDNAMRMAHNLLAKYNLEMAQIEAASGETSEPRGILKAVFYGRPWARVAAASVAKLFFCKYVYQSIPGEKNAIHMFIGKQSNGETAAEVAAFVVNSIRKESKSRDEARVFGNAWSRSFGVGAAHSIAIRVERMIKESKDIKPDNATTALVLANVYLIEADKNAVVIAEKFPKLRTGRAGKSQVSAHAMDQGHQYGKTIQLQKQIKG